MTGEFAPAIGGALELAGKHRLGRIDVLVHECPDARGQFLGARRHGR